MLMLELILIPNHFLIVIRYYYELGEYKQECCRHTITTFVISLRLRPDASELFRWNRVRYSVLSKPSNTAI